MYRQKGMFRQPSRKNVLGKEREALLLAILKYILVLAGLMIRNKPSRGKKNFQNETACFIHFDQVKNGCSFFCTECIFFSKRHKLFDKIKVNDESFEVIALDASNHLKEDFGVVKELSTYTDFAEQHTPGMLLAAWLSNSRLRESRASKYNIESLMAKMTIGDDEEKEVLQQEGLSNDFPKFESHPDLPTFTKRVSFCPEPEILGPKPEISKKENPLGMMENSMIR